MFGISTAIVLETRSILVLTSHLQNCDSAYVFQNFFAIFPAYGN